MVRRFALFGAMVALSLCVCSASAAVMASTQASIKSMNVSTPGAALVLAGTITAVAPVRRATSSTCSRG